MIKNNFNYLRGIITIAVMAFPLAGVGAMEKRLCSPNGQLTVTVSDNNGTPAYQVKLDGKTFVERSPLSYAVAPKGTARPACVHGAALETTWVVACRRSSSLVLSRKTWFRFYINTLD